MSKSPDGQADVPGPGDADRPLSAPRGYWGPPGKPWPPPVDAAPVGTPRPGHGTVTVNDLDDTWMAVWDDSSSPEQTEDGAPRVRIEDFEGSKEEVLRWARSRPAAEFLIFSRTANHYVSLPLGES